MLAQVGRLWTSLADYYIRQGQYESARDVYEEGLTTVVTVSACSYLDDFWVSVLKYAFSVGCHSAIECKTHCTS